MIKFIKNLFSKDHVKVKDDQHVHNWIHQYTTGNDMTRWQSNGRFGFSKSDVYKCDCGKMSVKHRSDPKSEHIEI